MTDPTLRQATADVADRLTDRAVAHDELLRKLAEPDSARAIAEVAAAIAAAIERGDKAIFFGNGGSAADAQHLSAELVGRFRKDRRALAAVALGTNPAITSALANDYGFVEAGIARELEAIGRPGDVAVAISTSGRSPNVLRALDVARERGLTTVALLGAGHELHGRVDHLVTVETTSVPLVQEMHSVIGHLLCEFVEHELGLV